MFLEGPVATAASRRTRVSASTDRRRRGAGRRRLSFAVPAMPGRAMRALPALKDPVAAAATQSVSPLPRLRLDRPGRRVGDPAIVALANVRS